MVSPSPSPAAVQPGLQLPPEASVRSPRCGRQHSERRFENLLRLLLIEAIRKSLRLLLHVGGELIGEDEPQTEWSAARAVPTRSARLRRCRPRCADTEPAIVPAEQPGLSAEGYQVALPTRRRAQSCHSRLRPRPPHPGSIPCGSRRVRPAWLRRSRPPAPIAAAGRSPPPVAYRAAPPPASGREAL